MAKYLVLLIIYQFSFAVMASADVETSPQSSIKRLIAYSKFGNGDIYVQLNTSASACSHEYFINKSSLGYESLFSMLRAVYQANPPVILCGYKNKKRSDYYTVFL